MARLWMVANEKEFESEINDFLMSSLISRSRLYNYKAIVEISRIGITIQ